MSLLGSFFSSITRPPPSSTPFPTRRSSDLGVAYRQLVPEGTTILTSGLGGVLPRGIPIGTVVRAAGEAEGWERTYLVRPAVHPAAVTHVMILTGPPVKSDLRSVFQSGGETP